MTFDVNAVAHAYAPGAEDYAAKFGDELDTNDFDRELVHRLVASLSVGARILDIGCGPAQIAAFVEAHQRGALAVDLTFEMLTIASRRQAATAFICADVRWLPFADGCCHGAVCWYSLHNLPRAALPGALGELRRVVGSGGRILIATHGGEGEEWHDTEWHGRGEAVVITYYGRDELIRLVRDAGFDDVDVTTRPPLPHEHPVQKLYVAAAVR